MNSFLGDLKFALRQLAVKPGFAAVAILTLALGIGANATVFSFFSGYLLKPLPYRHAAQLTQVDTSFTAQGPVSLGGISLPIYRLIKKHTDVFSATAFYHRQSSTLTVGNRTRQLYGSFASASLFGVLGVQPLLGHSFTAGDMQPGNGNVMVISYRLWQGRFGGARDVVGRRVKLDDESFRIIGVMPRGFIFPDRATAFLAPYTIALQAFAPQRFGPMNVQFIGIRKAGVTQAAATAKIQHAMNVYVRNELSPPMRAVARKSGLQIGTRSWHRALLGDRANVLWLLQGAVLLILLITCVNIANLLLSRILGRSHEIAIRGALGATRATTARQLLSETLCLTIPGGLAGIGLACVARHFLDRSPLGAGESVFHITLDWRVALFTLGAVLFTTAVVSVLPTRFLARTDAAASLQENARSGNTGRFARRVRSGLVVSELSLATGLLAVTGLLAHSFFNLQATPPGFRTDHVLTAHLVAPLHDYPSYKALLGFYTTLRKKIDALPGVEQAAMTQMLPSSTQPLPMNNFFIAGRDQPNSATLPSALNISASPGYFKALDIPIVKGRAFRASDVGKPVAIVNTRVAAEYFPDTDPIGRQIRPGRKSSQKRTIIGIAASSRFGKLSHPSRPAIYFDFDRSLTPSPILVIHTSLPPGELISPLRKLVAETAPTVALYGFRTMQAQVDESLRDRRMTMILLLAFGGIALALAVIGVYGVLSYAVGQRQNEFGIRLAMGALRTNLTALVIRDGAKLMAAGLGIGLALAVGIGYALDPLLFHVRPYDPLTLTATAAVLGLTTLLACYLPARRAARLNPAEVIHDQ